MNYEVLEKVKLLPVTQQKEVENFIENLYKEHMKSKTDIHLIAEKRRSIVGRLKGQIWMADDFEE